MDLKNLDFRKQNDLDIAAQICEDASFHLSWIDPVDPKDNYNKSLEYELMLVMQLITDLKNNNDKIYKNSQ
jgi:hypothetical protein